MELSEARNTFKSNNDINMQKGYRYMWQVLPDYKDPDCYLVTAEGWDGTSFYYRPDIKELSISNSDMRTSVKIFAESTKVAETIVFRILKAHKTKIAPLYQVDADEYNTIETVEDIM